MIHLIEDNNNKSEIINDIISICEVKGNGYILYHNCSKEHYENIYNEFNMTIEPKYDRYIIVRDILWSKLIILD